MNLDQQLRILACLETTGQGQPKPNPRQLDKMAQGTPKGLLAVTHYFALRLTKTKLASARNCRLHELGLDAKETHPTIRLGNRVLT
jgi:hypothetical protein